MVFVFFASDSSPEVAIQWRQDTLVLSWSEFTEGSRANPSNLSHDKTKVLLFSLFTSTSLIVVCYPQAKSTALTLKSSQRVPLNSLENRMWHTVYFLFQMHYLYECCSNYVIIQKLMHNNKPKDHQRNANGREWFLFKLWIHITFSLFLEGYKKSRFANLIKDSANVKSLSIAKEMKSMFPSLCLSSTSLEIWTASENWLNCFTFLFWPNWWCGP